MKWSKLGIRDHQEHWLQERIRATNSVYKILVLVLSLLLLSSVVFSTRVMTGFITGSMAILFMTILLHGTGFHSVSRILTSILPVIVASCIQGAYQMKGQLPNASGWIFIAAFQVLPFLLFAPTEKTARIISVMINLVVSALYENFNGWIELDQPPLTPPIQVLITNMIGLAMMLRLLYTIDGLYIKANTVNQDLIHRIQREKQAQDTARDSLDSTIAALNTSRAEEEKRSWVSRGLAEASKILREDGDQQKMFDRLISYLVKYSSANQGALFLAVHESEKTHLELKACYAYERKRFLEKRFSVGEGLLGQCFHECSPIYLTDVPENYVTITSGLGLATPRALILVPMVMDNKVYGVIEIASFKTFEHHQIEFLQDIGESMAIALHTMAANEHTKTLLAETQMLAEQMKAQEDAMRQNMEYVSVMQEEQARVEIDLRKIVEQQEKEIDHLKSKCEMQAG